MKPTTPLHSVPSEPAAARSAPRLSWLRLGYGLAFSILGAALVVAAAFVWHTRNKDSLDFDQSMAFAAFLLVATTAPIVVALLLRRLSTPLHAPDTGPLPRWLSPIVACVLLSIAISAAALAIYEIGSASVTRSVDRRLQAVVTLKISLVKNWLDEVREDIRLSVESPAFLKALDDWREAGVQDDSARRRLVDHLWRLSKTSHYVEIGLRDPTTGALLLTTSGDADSPEVRSEAVRAATSAMPVLEDFHSEPERDQSEALYLGTFAAVSPPGGGGRLVVHVGIDPRHELFPLIEQWPGAREAAEVVLVRREGDSMRVLNDDAGKLNKAASARQIPVAPDRYIAAALARGHTGSLRGDDDRNEPVFAYAAPVPGTAWTLVATLNESEAFAELNRITLLAASIAGALLMLGAWWWVENRRHVIVAQRYQTERARHLQMVSELSQRVVSVQEEERRRLSSDLHDRTGANLATINLNLKAIGRSIPRRGLEDDELLRETSDLLGDTIVSIREFCSVLRPAVLDYAGLVAALESSVEQFARRTGVAAHFDHSGFSGRCSKEVESMLFRIAQEALMNCAKHAQARHVQVTLAGSAEQLRLSVEDDGVGFDPQLLGQSAGGVGQGLLNMHERAAFAGAVLTLKSAPGCGTRVTIDRA